MNFQWNFMVPRFFWRSVFSMHLPRLAACHFCCRLASWWHHCLEFAKLAREVFIWYNDLSLQLDNHHNMSVAPLQQYCISWHCIYHAVRIQFPMLFLLWLPIGGTGCRLPPQAWMPTKPFSSFGGIPWPCWRFSFPVMIGSRNLWKFVEEKIFWKFSKEI